MFLFFTKLIRFKIKINFTKSVNVYKKIKNKNQMAPLIHYS